MVIMETARMTLRHMSMRDVEHLLGIFADPEAMRYYPGTKDVAETRSWIRWTLDSYRTHGHGLWIASLKSTNEFAGQCGLTVQEVEGRPEVEIGYLFLRALWGQGLATEAARACRDYGFAHMSVARLISLIDVRNAASRRVAEKLGMRLEKEITKWGKAVCLYAIARGMAPEAA
jgi:RimJ/RimL family protein N-acetyltransferase